MRTIALLTFFVPGLLACSGTQSTTTHTGQPAGATDAGVSAPALATDASAEVASPVRACGPGEGPPPTLAQLPDELWEAEWHVTESRAPNAAPAPLTAACTALAARATRARAPLARVLAAAEERDRANFEDVGKCYFIAGGAWVLEAGAGRTRSVQNPESHERSTVAELAWTLRFVKPDGQGVAARMPAAHGTLRTGENLGGARVALVHDYDGDGAAEILVVSTDGNPSAGDAQTDHAALYTFAQGAIGPYAKAPKGEIIAPIDVDADGRPDLLIQSEFAAGNTCGPSVFYGPLELAHAQADGGFVRDDAAARAWLRLRCEGFERAPTHLFGTDNPGGELPYRIACWRYWGVPAETLQQRATQDFTEDGEDHCTSREASLRSINTQTAFTLAPPCR